MKIKDLRLSKLKLIEHLGEVEPAWSPGSKVQSNIGGGSFVEIELDNGEIGIGPSCDESILNDAKNYLVGKSPIDVMEHFKFLIYKTKNIPYNGLAGIDIALWDLKGKIENKSISQILGRKKDFLIPYASFVILSNPDERATMASSLDKDGWKAIKVRLHHEDENLDIKTIQEIVESTSSNLKILVLFIATNSDNSV